MPEDEPEPVRRGREAMRRPVADYADPGQAWRLDIQCAGSCQVQHRLVAALVSMIPPGLIWAEAIPRLRCSRCGEPAAIAGLCGPPGTPGAGATWLLLKGTGRQGRPQTAQEATDALVADMLAGPARKRR